ncbi:hypothetical protein N0V83_003667 [Neocucurbitaria cava]|uniref:Fungal N-terminal domain-containing protein n=1 Tax=Neocucurbitaria cava TaxID=798079 RepID=A0A9W8YC84_9PLEO|nr:hypothetical protein N0V83_003667 [Neocucurbitaria cava]
MVIPFGVSAGDFIAGLKLFKDAIDSLSDVRGARADYIELTQTLSALTTALDAASQFDGAVHQAAITVVLQGCRECVKDFLTDIAKFELLKNKSVTVRRLKTGLKKVQWALCKKEDVLNFKGHLETHLGLLPDEQRTMFRMLEEALAERTSFERQMEQLTVQNRILETHLLEIKAAVQQQREIPPQVLLRRPVILIDAFEENRPPFHLVFINSFEALFAVFMIRFKDKGGGAVDRIRRQLFDMFEQSRQKRIDINGPWANAFLV